MKNRNLWIGIGVVAALCLCAAVVSFFVFREAGKRVMSGVKTDSADVAQAGARIADYTVPDGYIQQMSMSLLSYNFVIMVSEQEADGMIIMLAQFEGIGPETYDQESFKQQMQRSFEQQSGQRGVNMRVVEVKQMTIRGEEVPVTISEGQSQYGLTMRQLMTIFPAKSGMGMVMIQGTTDQWDQDVVDEFLQSIH